jgi:hypothetical protein
MYRCEARSVEGFIQQLAVCYVGRVECPRIASTDLDDLRLLAEWHEVRLQHASYQGVACLSV